VEKKTSMVKEKKGKKKRRSAAGLIERKKMIRKPRTPHRWAEKRRKVFEEGNSGRGEVKEGKMLTKG